MLHNTAWNAIVLTCVSFIRHKETCPSFPGEIVGKINRFLRYSRRKRQRRHTIGQRFTETTKSAAHMGGGGTCAFVTAERSGSKMPPLF